LSPTTATVIGASEPIGAFGGGVNAARGKAVQILAAKAGATHAELFVGPATGGGECSYIKTHFNVHAGGMTVSCRPATWQGDAVQLGVMSKFLAGRVRPDVKTVRLEYTHGAKTIIHPTRGYVLVAIPPQHRQPGDHLARVIGVNSAGARSRSRTFPSRRRRRGRGREPGCPRHRHVVSARVGATTGSRGSESFVKNATGTQQSQFRVRLLGLIRDSRYLFHKQKPQIPGGF
jgi:hypothetical protein